MEKILKKANELGHLLKRHEIVERYQKLGEDLEKNEESRKLLEEFLRASQMHQIKLQQGEAIEVEEKRELAKLEEKVCADSLLSEFLATQTYYMNVLDQVNKAIANPTGEPPSDSNIILPGEERASSIILPN